MASKPIAAMVMTQWAYETMFDAESFKRLRAVADLVGPFMKPAELGPARDATVALSGWGSPLLDESYIAALPKLKMLAHTGGTVKGIATEALYDHGVRVINAADANAVPVAHFTVMMMVSLLKQVPWLSGQMRGNFDQKKWDARWAQIRELQNITVGLIGASRIGRIVVELLRNYPGVKIKIYDPYLAPDAARLLGVVPSSLEDVCRCEVVSVHAPNIPETHHMLNATTLALLPDHAVLINTARGALIDEAALVAEVRRRPLYVALDVTDPEPPAADSPLRSEPNIILTPHIAGAIQQARKDMGRLAVDEVVRFLRGENLKHEVTKEMLAKQA